MNAKLLCTLAVLGMAVLFSGCAGTSPARLATTGIATATGAAAGAGIGTVVSGGNPIGTGVGGVIGATSGFVAGEAIGGYYANEMEKQKQEGYWLGRADATKEYYWTLQASQQRSELEDYGITKNYEITVPGGESDDGVRMVPHTVTFPVTE